MPINKVGNPEGGRLIDPSSFDVLGITPGRGASAELIAHFGQTGAGIVRPAWFVEMFFDSGTLRIWSGHGDFVIGADTFVGGGVLGIQRIEESKAIRATGLRARIKADQAIIALILQEKFQNRSIIVTKGAFQDDGVTLIGTYDAFHGFIDQINPTASPSDSEQTEPITVELVAESLWRDLQRPRIRYYALADQQIDYPDDDFDKYVPSLIAKELTVKPDNPS